MSNHRQSSAKLLPAGSKRVTHPRLGVRAWLIEDKYYRTRRDYLSQFQKHGDRMVKVRDNSLPD